MSVLAPAGTLRAIVDMLVVGWRNDGKASWVLRRDLCPVHSQHPWAMLPIVPKPRPEFVAPGPRGSTVGVKDHRLSHHATSRVTYMAQRHGQAAAILLIGLILFAEMPIRWLHATLTRSLSEGWLVLRALSWRHLLTWRRIEDVSE